MLGLEMNWMEDIYMVLCPLTLLNPLTMKGYSSPGLVLGRHNQVSIEAPALTEFAET